LDKLIIKVTDISKI